MICIFKKRVLLGICFLEFEISSVCISTLLAVSAINYFFALFTREELRVQ